MEVARAQQRVKAALTATNIRVFEAVARLQSVTRAADELGTSQPYISKQIAALEEQFHVQLFSRVGRRLYLTASGEALQQHARATIESLRNAEEMLLSTASRSRQKLRIVTSSTPIYMLPWWLADFKDKVPEMEISVLATRVDEVEQKVLSGEADLGFVAARRPRSRSLTVNILADDSLVLALHKGHPLAHRASVRLDELNKEQFIVRGPESASRALTEKKVFQSRPDWKFRLQINHIDAIKRSVEEGLGVSFISQRAIDRELHASTLAAVPIEGLELRRPICMLSNAHQRSPLGLRLAKHIANQML